jgi:hypothetical protein
MAYISKVTIGTGDKTTIDYQSDDCTLIVTYELERTDTDLLEFIRQQAPLIEKAHAELRTIITERRKARKNEVKEERPQNRENHQNSVREKAEPQARNSNRAQPAMATENQIRTALDLEEQLGMKKSDPEALANMTAREISTYIVQLIQERKRRSPVR